MTARFPPAHTPRARLLVILVLILTSASVTADRLELRNGDVITGTIRLIDAEHVIIETEYGLLEVERDAVLRGEFGLAEGEVVDALVFRYNFDASLEDSTGLNLATNNGMRFVADRHGSPAGALRSEGNGTFLSIAPTGELNSFDQFTVSFWVQLEDLGTTQYLLSKWNRAEGATADGKFTVQTAGGSLTAYFVDALGNYSWITAQSAIQPRTWHSIAVTFSGGRAHIYVDGEVVASDRFDFTGLYQDSSPILVMTAQAQTDEPYSYYNAIGTIDDLRLYSRALAPDEVLLLAADNGTE